MYLIIKIYQKNNLNSSTMKKLLLFALITLLNFSSGFSQKGNSINSAMTDIRDVFRYKNLDNNYKNYEGNPYLNSEFSLGTIINIEMQKVYSYPIRYNVYEDKIEIQKEDKSIVNLAKVNYFDIQIFEKKFQLIEYENKGEKKIGYLEVILNSKKIELYNKHSRTLISAKTAKSSYENDKPARFNSSESFYFKLKGHKIEFLPKKKKDFLKVFSSKSNQINLFMKKNKLKNSKKEDIVKIFKYYSTLG